MYRIFFYILIMGLLLSTLNLKAQVEPVDTSESKIIHIVFSEMGEGLKEGDILKRLLYGNIILRQDSMYMYCDTAILIENDLDAFGHVLLNQGDTLNIWADSLLYFGETKMALLKDSVVLKNKNNFLYTSALTYDVDKKIAKYDTFSQLTNDTVFVMSKKGTYDLNFERAYLKDSVIVDGGDFFIRTDSMNYDVKAKRVEFVTKTLILQDSSKIYCEEGYYDINTKNAYFSKNAQFKKGHIRSYADDIYYYGADKKYELIGDAYYTDAQINAQADTIIYDGINRVYYLNGHATFKDSTRRVKARNIVYNEIDKSYDTYGETTLADGTNLLIADDVTFNANSDLGLASGHVIWKDTLQNISLHSDEILFNKKKHFYQSYGKTRPWMEWIQDKDTLYVSADTILTEGEGNKYMKAFKDVKIYGNKMAGLCDSLVYAKEDSIINLFQGPIMWLDSTQLTGDTIQLIMRHDKIDSLRLSLNAFVIDKLVLELYDQINGKFIDGKLKEGKLNKMFVNKNAQAIYYIRDDDKKFIGVNNSLCSKMIFTLGEDKLKSVLFLVSPEFEMIPMKEILSNPKKLKGFKWRFDEKPLSLESIK